MKKRITVEFIAKQFKKEGYKLLSTEYINNKQKLKYICPEGHNHSICWSDWQQNRRCGYCACKYYDIDIIRKSFNNENYILLTDKYVSSVQKLDYVCSNGHKHRIAWSMWNQGQRCPYCYGNVRHNIEYINYSFEDEGYRLLTKNYINSAQKLEYICPNKHRHTITWNNWKSGWRCPFCYHERCSGPNHHNWKDGISFEPYCEVWADKEYKADIRNRDSNECQNPDCWYKKGEAASIVLHHIDYDKKNCSPSNLIALCRSCNSRANVNRGYWESFYNKILIGRGIIKCSTT